MLIACATLYFANQQVEAIKDRHDEILKSSVNEAGTNVEHFIQSRQKLIETFAFEKHNVLSTFAKDIENQKLKKEISDSLSRWFPSYFTFTLTDVLGNDLIDDLDGFVGDACQASIQDYVLSLRDMSVSHAAHDTVIHPQANNYHFDVMAPWQKGGTLKGIFFVSFLPDPLAEILKSHQNPNHYMALINKDRDYLIEVNADGARDIISAHRDINLTASEISEIRISRDIEGSRWMLVGYLEPGMISAKVSQLWTQASIILFILGLVGFISCWKIWQLAKAQEQAFRQLEVSNSNLANMADEQKALRVLAQSGEKTKADFLASMSHEIRTPLNAVIGLTELVLKSDLDDLQRNYLSKVTLAGKNLLALINDILDFSKIEAGKLQIENIAFDLDPVLENVAIVVNPKAEENGNELIISVDRTLPEQLIGDPLRLGQVLINLAGNAAKFTSHGEIVIDLVNEKDASGDWLSVSVKDNGTGMTQEQSAKLFKPFVQADQSVTRTHGGTGLGLSISLQLVEAMGGTIGAESAEGEGSRFFFKVPLNIPEGSTSRPTFDGIDPRITKILVVDDSDIIRDTLVVALEKLNFKVESASSGQEAVEKITKANLGSPFNAVLMDWVMPGMDGLDVVRHLRSKEGESQTPVIVMVSASNMAPIRDELTSLNISHALQKPINTSFLIDSLMAVFETNHPKRQVRQTHMDNEETGKMLNGVRILLAEDNELNQMVALGILQGAGAEVDVAENGAVVLQKLTEHEALYYAVVLMDIQMPVMDGLTATVSIRNEPLLAEIPIIAMTAHALDEEREKFTKAGMVDHITKPVDARDVIAKVLKWSNENTHSQEDTFHESPVADTPKAYDFDEVVKRLMLPPDIVKKLLQKFKTDYADASVRMTNLINLHQNEEAQMLAHALKGVAGTLGLMRISLIASELEESLANEDFNDKNWPQDELREAIDLAIKEIDADLPI